MKVGISAKDYHGENILKSYYGIHCIISVALLTELESTVKMKLVSIICERNLNFEERYDLNDLICAPIYRFMLTIKDTIC